MNIDSWYLKYRSRKMTSKKICSISLTGSSKTKMEAFISEVNQDSLWVAAPST